MPEFECDSFNEAMMKYSPWSGHRYFGYDFVANYKPGIIAELGSYYGCSSFTFLQAVKDFGLSTRFYSIDSGKGIRLLKMIIGKTSMENLWKYFIIVIRINTRRC